jgi:hypothetical protein
MIEPVYHYFSTIAGIIFASLIFYPRQRSHVQMSCILHLQDALYQFALINYSGTVIAPKTGSHGIREQHAFRLRPPFGLSSVNDYNVLDVRNIISTSNYIDLNTRRKVYGNIPPS